MSNNKDLLRKGMKYVFGAIPLFFLAPITLNIGFSAIKKDDNYIFSIVGAIAAFSGILLAVIGIRTILKYLFD